MQKQDITLPVKHCKTKLSPFNYLSSSELEIMNDDDLSSKPAYMSKAGKNLKIGIRYSFEPTSSEVLKMLTDLEERIKASGKPRPKLTFREWLWDLFYTWGGSN